MWFENKLKSRVQMFIATKIKKTNRHAHKGYEAALDNTTINRGVSF